MSINKLPNNVVSLLQKRIADEKTAEYYYQTVALWCRSKGYDNGFKYFSNEAHEEKHHFKKLTNYLQDWGSLSKLPLIEPQEINFIDLSDALTRAYNMEYQLMLDYQEVSDIAFTSHLVTFDFLKYYRDIQNESVIQYSTLLNKLATYPKEMEVFFINELE